MDFGPGGEGVESGDGFCVGLGCGGGLLGIAGRAIRRGDLR